MGAAAMEPASDTVRTRIEAQRRIAQIEIDLARLPEKGSPDDQAARYWLEAAREIWAERLSELPTA